MQQTEKYKLNLIESSDPFLPEGLNQNTQKIEDTLSEYQAKMDGKYLMLDSNLSALVKNVGSGGKTARIAWGTYDGSNGNVGASKPRVLEFGFYPVYVLIVNESDASSKDSVNIRGMEPYRSDGGANGRFTFLENGVSFYGVNGPYRDSGGHTYFYLAIGYDNSAEQ